MDVAIYHLSVSAVQRSKGRSAVAAAAYRAGMRLVDERTGELADYTRRRGVVWSGLVRPEGAPSWDRSQLWNAAEAAERRKDGTPAREVEVSLPHELSEPQRRALAVAFAQRLATVRGCAVDVAIHAPAGDERNHHAHLLMTTRELGPEGLGAKCPQERAGRDRAADLEQLRAEWAHLANAALARIGSAERIDHRSHQARGLDAAPGMHLGPTATAIERQGQESERGRWARAWQSFEARLMDYISRITASLGQLRQAQLEGITMDKSPAPGGIPVNPQLSASFYQDRPTPAEVEQWDRRAFVATAEHWATAHGIRSMPPELAGKVAVYMLNTASPGRHVMRWCDTMQAAMAEAQRIEVAATSRAPVVDRAAELERLLEAHQETPAAPLQGDPFAGIEDEHHHHQEAGPRPGK